ncbi:uncharacterized protein LALA0_S03e08900g [Lachancea lanzarotensis]|uniref:LALA0S03e08900g1_1 n=1 Tax=Lachancea lanzarotensis TaxID=1245769 RepID=A0A0C7N503_9SACH|nr:uncharacterized protein LALA0_S03e08900g [Lachancea lanzarotensis]CEP61701.1 LALA0S03e08900g1_1 [Lachancea lanzarotensis]
MFVSLLGNGIKICAFGRFVLRVHCFYTLTFLYPFLSITTRIQYFEAYQLCISNYPLYQPNSTKTGVPSKLSALSYQINFQPTRLRSPQKNSTVSFFTSQIQTLNQCPPPGFTWFKFVFEINSAAQLLVFDYCAFLCRKETKIKGYPRAHYLLTLLGTIRRSNKYSNPRSLTILSNFLP